MAKFNNPSKAQGACDVWFEGCVGTGTKQECAQQCGDEKRVSAQAFRGQSGKRVVKVTPRGSARQNQEFLFATGKRSEYGEFLRNVGIAVVGVGAWFYIAAPILKKIGVKPLSI